MSTNNQTKQNHNKKKADPNSPIVFLSVGTQPLLTAAMDQYLRSQTNIDTYYSPNMKSALRIFSERIINILLTEVDLGDGSAFRLVQNLGGPSVVDELFLVLALPESNESEMALGAELEARHVLIKPLTAASLSEMMKRFHQWQGRAKEKWQTLVQDAYFCVREKRFKEAEKNYVAAIQEAPSNPIPAYRAGMYYLKKPDVGIAERFFKMALDINPKFIQATSALGSLYLSLGDLDRAEDQFKKAHTLSPLNPDRLVEVMKLYLSRCMNACKSSIKIDPGNTIAHYALGKLMAVQKDYPGTIRELETALPHLHDDLKKEAETFIALARKLGSLAKE